MVVGAKLRGDLERKYAIVGDVPGLYSGATRAKHEETNRESGEHVSSTTVCIGGIVRRQHVP
jgi:hypothetical protein